MHGYFQKIIDDFRRTKSAIFGTIIGGLTAIGANCSASENELPIKYVNTHAFLVQVKPEDKDAKDAITAELFISRFPQNGWLPEGACEIFAESGGEKLFSRAVKIHSDGTYYFTSRGVDKVGSAAAPKKGDAAQVKVISDTRAPQVDLTVPRRHAIFRAGEKMMIEWLAVDPNLAHNGIDLLYSFDGENWKTVAENLPNTGHYEWQAPAQNFSLRVTARDYAGNRGGAESPEFFRVMIGEQAKAITAVASEQRRENARAEMRQVLTSANESTTASPPIFRAEAVTSLPASEKTSAELHHENPTDVQANAVAAADKFMPPNPQTATKHPQLDANSGEIPLRPTGDDGKTAYIAYVMGGNLVRQGRLQDSLRYFRSAVDIDPNFDEAWNDMGLVYRQLGAHSKADACIVRALKIEPNSPRYLNTRGLIYQNAGLEILRDPASADESLARANDLILFAVKTYGAAVDEGLRRGTLAERAETYFHLGEICYFANQDPTGARQYWLKVLELHTPTPELDEVMLDRNTVNEKLTQTIYEKNTELWVNLKTWQEWAREYLRQLNDLERGVSLPRSPFSGATFMTFAAGGLGANTSPIGSSPEALTLLPDGSYAAIASGYTAMLPVATSTNQPQVQVINNYIGADGQTAITEAGAVRTASIPCPICKTFGCRLAAHQPAILEAQRKQRGNVSAPENAYAATRYYEQNQDGYYESYQQEIFGVEPPRNVAAQANVFSGAPRYSQPSPTPYNPSNGYNYQSMPAPVGRGGWNNPNYGAAPEQTYRTPRGR